MSWITPLFNSTALVLATPDKWENYRSFADRLDEAFKVAAFYAGKTNPDAADHSNLRELVGTLESVITHYITKFPVKKAGALHFENIHKYINNKVFTKAQRQRLNKRLRQKAEEVFRDEPAQAYRAFLDERLDRDSKLRGMAADLTLEYIDVLAKESPTLAVKGGLRALWYVKDGSRIERKLIAAIKRHAPGYVEEYEECGEGVNNIVTARLVYEDNQQQWKLAEEIWRHYIRNLTLTHAPSEPKRGDPPGILTLPSESDNFRMQAYKAITDLVLVAVGERKPAAVRLGRESFQECFDHLASVNPAGAVHFAYHLIHQTAYAERERNGEIAREVGLLRETAYAKFIALGLLETHPEANMMLHSINLQTDIAGHTHDPEKRCFALEAALARGAKLTEAKKYSEAAHYNVTIIESIDEQNTPPKYEGERPVIVEDEKQAARRVAVRAAALDNALAGLAKFAPGGFDKGAKLALKIAKLAPRASEQQNRALAAAYTFAKGLKNTAPLRAKKHFEELVTTATSFRKRRIVGEAQEELRVLGTPQPLEPAERGALKVLLESSPA